MKIYLEETVYEAAKQRIEFLFNEFEHVVVAFSGGKDSTVCLFVTLEVARKLNRLPLEVWFIDQEAEWQGTIDYCRIIRDMPDIDFKWFQMPIQIFNATSHTSNWLWCWEVGAEHMREKEPGAIVENIFKTTRFKELFKKIPKVLKKGVRSAIIGGVRAEESPSRKLGLTESVKYKHVTWGRQNYHYSDDHCNYTFYPLYDWSYKDIWKYIHSSGVPYNHVYDEMFRYGVNPMDMRISNLNHETALSSMLLVQEIEPETWNKLAARIEGVNTVNQLRHDRACPQDLPFMFSDWQEYRDYLTHYLTKEPERTIFQEKWARWDAKTVGMKNKETMYKVQISCVILNDYHFTTFANWSSRIDVMDYFRYQRGMWHPRYAKSKYIFEDAK